MTTCKHDLAEMETACADGLCPLCLRDSFAPRLEAELNEARQGWRSRMGLFADGDVDRLTEEIVLLRKQGRLPTLPPRPVLAEKERASADARTEYFSIEGETKPMQAETAIKLLAAKVSFLESQLSLSRSMLGRERERAEKTERDLEGVEQQLEFRFQMMFEVVGGQPGEGWLDLADRVRQLKDDAKD